MSKTQRDALVEHAREDSPNECCGLVWGSEGAVEEVARAENGRKSPYAFELTFADLQKANDLDDEGYEVGIYHSHPKSEARPSQTDINLAQYPDWTYLIVSLMDEPVVRAWKIADGHVSEEQIEVD